MKKLLLGTTAILGVVGFAAAAAADAPRVTVGGFIDFQAAYSDDDTVGRESDIGFRNDTEIHFSVDGKTDAGLGYGAVIELEADATDDTTASGTNADRTYVYLDGANWGRFELGTNTDAATALKIDAATIARATGGIDGDWFRFVGIPGAAIGAPGATVFPLAVVRPDLLTQHGGFDTPGVTENAGKVTYYSPSFSGFQFGVSYTPNIDAKGQLWNTTSGATASDVFSGGLTYNRQFDQVALGLSATGEYGKADVATFGGDDLEGYALGASLGVAGFSFAGSWAQQDIGALDAEFWTLGAAYNFGAFGVSATYMDSELDLGAGATNDFDNLVFGVDYALAPGLTPYAEVSLFDLTGAGGVGSTDGTVFIVGTQLAF